MNDKGITIVQQPDTMIARKNVKLVDSLTLVEHGTLVTVAIAVNASGNMILPNLYFLEITGNTLKLAVLLNA